MSTYQKISRLAQRQQRLLARLESAVRDAVASQDPCAFEVFKGLVAPILGELGKIEADMFTVEAEE